MKTKSTSKLAGLALAMLSALIFVFAHTSEAQALSANAHDGNAFFSHLQFQPDNDSRMRFSQFGRSFHRISGCCLDANFGGLSRGEPSVFGSVAFHGNFQSSPFAGSLQFDTLRQHADGFIAKSGFDRENFSAFSVNAHHFDHAFDTVSLSSHGSDFDEFAPSSFHSGQGSFA